MRRLWGYIAGGFAFLIAAIAILLKRNKTLSNKLSTARDETDLARTTERKEAATLKFGEAYEKYRKARAEYNSRPKRPK